MKALDAGAQGVIVPMVNSKEEAERAAGACRYPPQGYRSWGPTRAAMQVSGFGPESANRAVVCMVMIETVEGLAAVDEILAVPGVDGVYVGPNDLAVTHGMTPDATASDPEHRRLIEKILQACVRRGLIAGIHCSGPDTAIRWREAGFRMLNVDNDSVFMRTGAATVLEALRGVKREAAKTGY
jgi:4-hydroxy-2-oxoheptanedioate aldolase